MSQKPRKSPLKSPDSAFEGLIRTIGAPILQKMKQMDAKKPSPRPSKAPKKPTMGPF